MIVDAMNELKTLLSKSETWQTAVGATGNAAQKEAAAAARVYVLGKKDADPARPFVALREADYEREKIATQTFFERCAIGFRFEFDYDASAEWEAVYEGKRVVVLDIMEDVLSAAETTGSLSIASIQHERNELSGRNNPERTMAIMGTINIPAEL